MASEPVARPILVRDSDALRAAVTLLRAAPRVALDTEGNGMHAYRTSLCVVQLCVARDDAPTDEVFVIDPLTGLDLTPLGEVLGPDGPAVIIHDLAFDARLLALVSLPLAGVIDTALHARFLGLKETGLGTLLAQRCNVQVSKAMQQDDWAKRPLSEAQLAYLADDVAYLGPLAAGLEHDARTTGIEHEIAIETEYALTNARAEESPVPPYARIKGVRDLPPIARAVLRDLAAVREAAAERWDIPVGRVFSNQGLVAAARARPKTAGEMRRSAGLSDRGAALIGELLAAVARGEQAGDVPEPERVFFQKPVPVPGEIAARKTRETALGAWRQKESAARNVDLQVVLPGHALNDIARVRPRSLEALAEIPGFGDYRVERYGALVLAALDEAERTNAATE